MKTVPHLEIMKSEAHQMDAIELILEFDLFSHKHKKKCKNEKVNVTYLFKTVFRN